MVTENNHSVYDKSIGSEQRSAVAATKLWAILFGIVLLIGIGLIVTFFFSGMGGSDAGRGGAGSTSSSPGP
ncbi:MAG: hypothetical protein PSX80_13435 [bacterium]|nr:hypothetical protein [bacterium]